MVENDKKEAGTKSKEADTKAKSIQLQLMQQLK